jgi:hypothetical protein
MPQSLTRSRLLTGCLLLLTAAALVLVPMLPAAAVPKCAAGGVKVSSDASPAAVVVTDTRTGTGVSVLVTMTGTSFAITPTEADVTLDSASWCVKAGTQTQNGTGTSGAFTKPVGYLVVYTVTTGIVDPVGSCWDGQGGFFDFQFNGPIDTVNNGFQTNSQDGTCSGGQIGGLRTVVQAPDQATAIALCQSVAGLANAANMQNLGGPGFGFPAAPADYWSCF